MKIIDRYIGRTMLGSVAATLTVLLGFYAFLSFIGEVEDVGKGEYDLYRAVEYILLSLPRQAFELFPAAALIGTLMALGALAANNELTVLRAAGVSSAQIVGSVMKTGALLMLCVLVLGETGAPLAEQEAQARRAEALSGEMSVRAVGMEGATGLWVRDQGDFIHIGGLLPGFNLRDVEVYDFGPERRLEAVIRAERGHYRDGEWVLENVQESRLDGEGVTRNDHVRRTWEAGIDPSLLRVVAVRAEHLSSIGLYRYIDYLERNDIDAARYRNAFWLKVTIPPATAVMVFLAIPFVFGSLREQSAGARVVLGVAVGILFYLVNQLFQHLGLVYGIPPALTAVLPTLVFLGIALWLFRRVH